MRAAAQLLGGQLGEPALDEVQPRAAGRGEVQDEPRVREQPALDRRRLVGGGCCRARGARRARRGPRGRCVCRNFLNSIARWRLCSAADHLAGGDVQRGVEAGGAVSACSRGSRAAGVPGSIGRIGAVRSSAWIWDFSSTHSTTARSGGLR